MKYRVDFARDIIYHETGEAIVIADTLEEAQAKFDMGECQKYLITTRTELQMNPVEGPTFEPVVDVEIH